MDNRQTNDEEINVEEIMRSIRDKIRKDHARIPTHKIESSSRETPQIRSQNLDNELSFLLHNFDITNNDYSISSHRPLIGTVLIRGRKLVHGEVRRYVDPITWKQNMFNINAARVLNDVVNIVDQEMIQLRSAIDDLGSRPGYVDSLRSDVDPLRSDVDSLRFTLLRIIERIDNMESAQRDVLSQWQHSVDSLKDELRSEIIKNNELAYERTSILFARLNAINEANSDVRTIVSRVSESAAFTNSVIPSSYLSFENEFRGSEADIKTRQKYYLSYFNDDNTLDIGCGRGEFLELLREKGVRAIGLELDEQMYHYCTSKGLDVKKMDALCYLASVPDATIGGVFMAQVIEHIEPSQVPVFLQMIYGKLGFGKYLVIETVNLLNVSAFMNFYVDPTHIRPVHPLYLEYLLKACGYRDIKVVYRTYATVPENIDQNKIKEIAPDYAIICKK